MTWTKNFFILLLITYISSLGYSRALPAASPTCNADVCENSAWSDASSDNPIANLPPRIDRLLENDLDDDLVNVPEVEHRLFHEHKGRAVALAVPKPAKPPAVAPNKPNDPPTEPTVNPQAGLDPDKPAEPNTPSTEPSVNPQAGLDPDKPRPTTEADPSPTSDTNPSPTTEAGPSPNTDANPSPTTEANPTPTTDTDPSPAPNPSNVDPKPSPAGDGAPDEQPTLLTADDLGCGMKRADACPGPSDNIGEDVPGEAPDIAANTRANRPANNDADTGYDYLDEVQRERGTGLGNDKLENLDTRINNQAPDAPVRNDEISNAYSFDSKLTDDDAKPTDFTPISSDDVFSKDLDHDQFKKLLDIAGIELKDTSSRREGIRSPGQDSYVLKMSWSGDQKVLFADWSYKKYDQSTINPKPHFTELTMAALKGQGVDPKNIQAIAQTRISNDATTATISSIYKSFKAPFLDATPIVLSRSDTDPAKKEAFDAFFRTDNGKGTLNLLAYHANDFGLRRPDKLIIQRQGSGSSMFCALITLA